MVNRRIRIRNSRLKLFQLIRCPQTSRAHLIVMIYMPKAFAAVESVVVRILQQVHSLIIAEILVVSTLLTRIINNIEKLLA